MKTFIYSVAAFQDGDLNPERFIADAKQIVGLEQIQFITHTGTTVSVVFQTEISQEAKFALDALVAEHRDDLHHLPTVKQLKFRAIDSVTIALIESGFTYQGIRFELYLEAQVRLLGMIVMAQFLTYPILYNSKDDTQVIELNNAGEVMAMAGGALGSIGYYLNTGTGLKQQVREATTVEQVNAITDPRSVP